MKKTTLILLLFLICGIAYSQNDDIIIASLGGYCSGSIRKKEITDSPEIKLSSDNPDVTISKIGFFSNNRQNCVDYWTKGGQLNSKMIDRITTLNPEDKISFNVYVNTGDTVILIHPLHLKISTDKKNPCSCYDFGLANIKGITNGKLPKKELINEGKLTITSDSKEIKLINYKVTSFVKGIRKVISCQSSEFNSGTIRLIHNSGKFQRIYFSDIRISVNGKCFFMNPIEIQLE